MRALVVAALAAVGLAGCEAREIADAKEAVANRTRDPASVKFRQVRAEPQANGSTAICGELNAKNAYGGYAGFEGFVVVGHQVLIESEGAQAIEANTRYCIMNGQTPEQFRADPLFVKKGR